MSKDIYKDILVIVVGLLVVDWFFNIPYLHDGILIIGILAVFFTKFADGLSWLWMKLAVGLGWINSRILLTILYYFILVPLSLMARLFKGNTMVLKDRDGSLYTERNHKFTSEDFKNPW